ncbi:hypothetical protein BU24DRAFT_447600 [Aaosphaeria arxii CBS 175.79]|uniref:Zn(2)-C6 fungal-type domain-containing protein n=1 Tax=Aaosphaeria arxii CBS 175.79 TaxID=1450172 RepID=A0A6A5Y1S1_9PLEO|nr:uncharacterized protein BU24DRAFT_447600 [Aaosphaeria arxii CBS 175.79]KAF2019007.1 hypothetical protein BU24DRAFT_447600 [Aaosphaeria arxii CBS 175.79]
MFSAPPPKENKHVACARCRERKVKCDGGKPGCRRCQRNGHSCQYVRGKKQQTPNEWVQHLRTFSAAPSNTKTHNGHASKAVVPQSSGSVDSTAGRSASSEVSNLHSRSPSPYEQHSLAYAQSDTWNAYGAPNTSWPQDGYCSTAVSNASFEDNPSNFMPMAPFYADPGYQSGYLMPENDNSFLMRSSTPTSQASEAISTEECVDPAYIPYPPTSYYAHTPVSLPQSTAPIPFNYGYQTSMYTSQF